MAKWLSKVAERGEMNDITFSTPLQIVRLVKLSDMCQVLLEMLYKRNNSVLFM